MTHSTLAYIAIIDAALGKANCTPDGYLNLSAAESAIVSLGERQGIAADVIADRLIELRREGQLFNMLKASVQIGELQRKYEAVLADVETLREMVRGLSLTKAA